MWNALRLSVAFLFAQSCLGQISYRVVRTEYHDDFPDSADYGATEQQASTASHTGHYEYDFGQKVALPETREVELFTCILIVTIAFSTPQSAKSRLQGGDVFSTTTRIATVLTIVDGVEGPTDYATTISVAPNGEAIARLDLTSFSKISPNSTGLCDSCSLTVVAGACLSGDCGNYDMAATNENVKVQSAVCGDPYTDGLLGQKIDWAGEDGGWYCLISDGDDFQLNVRVTAPMPEEFPDRQFVSGVSLLLANGHSLGIEVNKPYTVKTDVCVTHPSSPCLADGALRVLIDNEEISDLQIRADKNVHVSATNLPNECHPVGEELFWTARFDEMTSTRRFLRTVSSTLDRGVMEPDTVDAPAWCARYLEDGVADLLATKSNHATFRVQTSAVNLRIIIGVAQQDWVTANDGGDVVRPELEVWRTDIGVEWHLFSNTAGGMLGETARFLLDNDGMPTTDGLDAIGGPIESYRVAGALGVDFKQLHNK